MSATDVMVNANKLRERKLKKKRFLVGRLIGV